jgi:hypothetical protein
MCQIIYKYHMLDHYNFKFHQSHPFCISKWSNRTMQRSTIRVTMWQYFGTLQRIWTWLSKSFQKVFLGINVITSYYYWILYSLKKHYMKVHLGVHTHWLWTITCFWIFLWKFSILWWFKKYSWNLYNVIILYITL